MKIEKYLITEKTDPNIKQLIRLSKDFISDMKIISGKYDFQSIDGVTRKFLKSFIDDLNEIYKRM